MKFEKIEGKWVIETGCVVAVEYINFGEYYDTILGKEVIDICTGEKYGKQLDEICSEFAGENIYRLIKNCPVVPEYCKKHRTNKKSNRKERIRKFTGVNWDIKGQKTLGRNRGYRRRMYPSRKDFQDFEEFLPF